jgi:protein-L-isoaspartate(D-aspartate) O-methyltransferase
MVDEQLVRRGITSRRVLDAMRRVPRHEFVPEALQRDAYEDRPLAIGHGQTISQPFIVACMTQLLDPGPADRVLEIGTGSGYQSAILAELSGRVYSLEVVEALSQRAGKVLERLGYRNVQLRTGDGYGGWPDVAPVDRIILTAAPPEMPAALVDQLARGGTLVAPIGAQGGTQVLTVARRTPGGVTTEQNLPVLFVPMVGRC